MFFCTFLIYQLPLTGVKLSASIVAYKNPAPVIQRAIDCFLAGTKESTLYLIDNSPTQELNALTLPARVEYISNVRNAGFGAAHNIALRKTLHTSDYHLILNPDISFDADVLPALHQFMESHRDVGLVMPKVLNPAGELQYLCRLLPTPRTMVLRSPLNFLQVAAKKENYYYELQFADHNAIMDVPFLSGCFMFIRTSVLVKSGLFDERFFLYAEDVDLSRRIQRYSRTVYFPGVTIRHHSAGLLPEHMGRLLHKVRSLIQYFNKWGWFNDAERDHINEQTLRAYARP